MSYLAKRTWLALALLGVLHCTTTAASATPTLSGASVFDGYFGGYHAYPESMPCGSFHLYVIAGTDPNGPIVNNNISLNIPLSPGPHTFTLLGTEGPNTSQINFGDPSSLPAVTLNLSDGAASGSLTIAHGSSGSLVLGTNTVSVTSFNWTPYDQSSVNRVGTCGIGADSWYDAIGQLTIEVSPPPPVLTQIQVMGPPGGWLTQANGDGGIYNLYLYDQHGTVLNPDGLVNYALPDGTYTLTLRATYHANGPVFYLNMWLNNNSSGPIDIAVSTASPLGSAVLGGKSVKVTSFTWLNGGQPDQVSTDYPAEPDGIDDSVGEFTIEVSTYVSQNLPPVADAGSDQTVEGAGPLTSVTLNGTGSSDPDGDVLSYSWSEYSTEISTESSPTLSLAQGTHTFTLTVDDGQGETAVDEVVVNLVDTTAPVVTAALTAIRHSRDDDEDGNSYRVTATATDAVDPNPVVSALITQPLTSSTSMVVSYKRERKNSIEVKMERRRLQVKLEGPSELALRALWTQVLAAGGFAVANSHEVQLAVKKDKKDEYEAQYRFDQTLKLTSAKGPGLKLAVWAIDAAGNQSPRVEVVPGKRARSDRDGRNAKLAGEGSLPASFGLEANYPNPFNPSTTLRYNLVEAGQVQLTVYNVMGQQIRVLVDEMKQSGAYQVEWDSRDEAGQDVAPGLYLYRLVSGNQTALGKMLLVK